eukprot:COSAG01_NODE_12369_length_1750_cov_1.150030_1_plen_127_part_10
MSVLTADVCTQDEKVKAVVEQLQTNPDAVMGQIEADEELQRKLSTLVQAGATSFFSLPRLPLMRLSCCLPAQRVWPRACAVPGVLQPPQQGGPPMGGGMPPGMMGGGMPPGMMGGGMPPGMMGGGMP